MYSVCYETWGFQNSLDWWRIYSYLNYLRKIFCYSRFLALVSLLKLINKQYIGQITLNLKNHRLLHFPRQLLLKSKKLFIKYYKISNFAEEIIFIRLVAHEIPQNSDRRFRDIQRFFSHRLKKTLYTLVSPVPDTMTSVVAIYGLINLKNN